MPTESHLRAAFAAFAVSTTIIASGLGFCACAHADEVSSVAAGLLHRIGAAFPQYDIPEPPQIHLMAPSALRGRCGRGVSACAAMTEDGTAYIFLPSNLDFSKPKAQAVLIHELLHATQWANGRLPHPGNRFVLESEARKAERLVNGRRQ